MNKIGNKQFHVMCEMWGVENAVDAAKHMGMIPTKEQIEAERQKEHEQNERWNRIFKPKEGT